ncbi:hypothetical protein GGS20DRAFT_531302 [Poronia punctata]|nr:hypothetical protein GGS20DRAFT_531302 [Poronia punctata]
MLGSLVLSRSLAGCHSSSYLLFSSPIHPLFIILLFSYSCRSYSMYVYTCASEQASKQASQEKYMIYHNSPFSFSFSPYQPVRLDTTKQYCPVFLN